MSRAENIRTFGVVGAGQMGSGIAQAAAMAGLAVVMNDRESGYLDRAMKSIDASLRKFAEKGTVSRADADAALGRIQRNENLELKTGLFRALDRICRPGATLASNTSSISITKIAAVTQRPTRVIGMHFMNPVPLMKLVEIIPGQATSAETVEETRALAVRLGKTAVVSQDLPGFIANRVLMPLVNEAIYALFEGVGTRDDIDTVLTLGMRHPMGPLTLADFIGLDTCLAIMEVLHEGFGDPKYRPCPLLRRMVDAGHLGRKSGRGFYDYPAESKR
jgi:3-hydroxybutyryl-CoA dehydrogenase